MIQSHDDYKAYLEADRIALGLSGTLRDLLLDQIWRYQRVLRKVEYLTNCRRNVLSRLIARLRLRRLGTHLGFSIPANVFGPGLSIAHRGTIVVNSAARVGANCRIHVCVGIGTAAGHSGAAPHIGDNCYIGPGAKLFGPIRIGDNTAIGANAVVHASYPEGNVTLGGVPAKIISDKGSEGLLIKGWQPSAPGASDHPADEKSATG